MKSVSCSYFFEQFIYVTITKSYHHSRGIRQDINMYVNLEYCHVIIEEQEESHHAYACDSYYRVVSTDNSQRLRCVVLTNIDVLVGRHDHWYTECSDHQISLRQRLMYTGEGRLAERTCTLSRKWVSLRALSRPKLVYFMCNVVYIS